MQKKIGILLLSWVLIACDTNKNNVEPSPILVEVPSYFPYPQALKDNIPNKNQIDLGKKLFFDPALSSNDAVSCASCHKPSKSFSDQSPVSLGVNQLAGVRNAMPLFNLAWQTDFFWDGGAKSLELQSLGPITAHNEMNMDLAKLPAKLKALPDYNALFYKAFGKDTIITQYITTALAQFERTLVSGDSKYDQYLIKQLVLSNEELQGEKVFKQKCQQCHSGVLFTDLQYHNNGLDNQFPDLDGNMDDPKLGRARISLSQNDIGKYKTPTLRNLSFTAPYMHDGRLATIDEVLDHYQNGIISSATLSPFLQASFSITEEEKASIKLFLQTLNDTTFVRNNQ